MRLFLFCSDMIIPVIILGIVCYGVTQHVDVYESFIKGANSGFQTVIKIMPTMLALMIAVGILRASGLLETITVVKMFSSSAATGLLLDLYKEYGTDSRIGLIASISMACTETIFYTMSVYFMTAKVRKSRYTLPGALIATFAGIAASVVLAGMF